MAFEILEVGSGISDATVGGAAGTYVGSSSSALSDDSDSTYITDNGSGELWFWGFPLAPLDDAFEVVAADQTGPSSMIGPVSLFVRYEFPDSAPFNIQGQDTPMLLKTGPSYADTTLGEFYTINVPDPDDSGWQNAPLYTDPTTYEWGNLFLASGVTTADVVAALKAGAYIYWLEFMARDVSTGVKVYEMWLQVEVAAPLVIVGQIDNTRVRPYQRNR